MPKKQIRIFFSSPGDVQEERGIGREVIAQLSKDHLLQEGVQLQVVMWDDPDSRTSMPANVLPQEAVSRGLARPSDCDIVVVLFWNRMGTPLDLSEGTKPNGSPFRSGTEWELNDALCPPDGANPPSVLLYRRTDFNPDASDPDDPEFLESLSQRRLVNSLFDELKSERRFAQEISGPEEFRDLLQNDLKHQIKLLLRPGPSLAKTSAAPAFQSRIEAFFDEYLKSEIGPVPFGGREAELNSLDEWLDDGDEPSRFLITAPAGRGKSALLVRWIQRLQKRARIGEDGWWHLVFVPISIRFDMNDPKDFYRALAERICAFAEMEIETPTVDATGYYADKVREALNFLARSDQYVLVIIDGLDEALRGEFDDTIFPKILPRNLRVLVSARWQLGDIDSEGWLRRLDWFSGVRRQTLELKTLSETDIGDVLVKMGAPTDVVGAEPELVRRLSQLTIGEPLLLRYYAEDLWRMGDNVARITRADLDSLTPGFGAYFDRWLECQQKAWRDAGESIDQNSVDAVLAILALAYGPLEGSDILKLTRRITGDKPAFTPQGLIAPLRRFVVGHGTSEQGYVLSHPKIGEHLKNERFASIKNEVTKAFVDWGKSVVSAVNKDLANSPSVPQYILRFYSRYLQTCNACLADFMELVEDGWQQAWEKFEGSQIGFSRDVRVALVAARKEGPLDNLDDQLRCIMTLSSIQSLGHRMPMEMIFAAVRQRIFSASKAIQFARYMKDPFVAAQTLCIIAVEFVHDPKRREALLSESILIAKSVQVKEFRFKFLAYLIQHVSDNRRQYIIADLIETAANIDSINYSLYDTIQKFGCLLPQVALDVIHMSSNKDFRTDSLIELAGNLWGNDKRKISSCALVEIKGYQDIDTRSRLLIRLAENLSGGEKHKILSEALELVNSIRKPYKRTPLLITIAGQLPADERNILLKKILRSVNRMRDIKIRAKLLLNVVKYLQKAQKDSVIRRVEKFIDEIDESYLKARLQCKLARYLDGKKRRDTICNALSIARAHILEDPNEKILSISVGLCADVLPEVLAIVHAVASDHDRAKKLIKIAERLDDTQRDDVIVQAYTAIKSIESSHHKIDLLKQIIDYLNEDELIELLQIAKTTDSESVRSAMLGSIAGRLSRAQLEVACQEIQMIDDGFERVEFFGRLAEYIDDDYQSEVLEDALLAAQRIRDELDRAEAFIGLANRLGLSKLADSMGKAKMISAPQERASVLSGFEKQLFRALGPIRIVGDHHYRARAATVCEAQICAGELSTMLSMARAAGDERSQVQSLIQVALRARGQERTELAVEMLKALLEISDRLNRSKLLEALLVFLPMLSKIGDQLVLRSLHQSVKRAAEWFP